MKKFALSLVVIFSTTYLYAQQNVEEVIVTATKTEKTLQEVPVAVSVVTADTIEKLTSPTFMILGQLFLHLILEDLQHLLRLHM